MKTRNIFFCKARNLPVYYKVDVHAGIIESIKDWDQYPKSIDRYNYSAVFAHELDEGYKSISRADYEETRERVSTEIAKRQRM
ncbi:MAG: hypothetical protein AAFY71_11175 [Bacteroidota bacterium]